MSTNGNMGFIMVRMSLILLDRQPFYVISLYFIIGFDLQSFSFSHVMALRFLHDSVSSPLLLAIIFLLIFLNYHVRL